MSARTAFLFAYIYVMANSMYYCQENVPVLMDLTFLEKLKEEQREARIIEEDQYNLENYGVGSGTTRIHCRMRREQLALATTSPRLQQRRLQHLRVMHRRLQHLRVIHQRRCMLAASVDG